MSELKMPSLGADMDAGTLLEWKVAVGTPVHKGQIVAVVDTQKAAMEIECFEEGVVTELLIEPGTKVPVGTVLARLADGPAGPAPRPPGLEGLPAPTPAPMPAPAARLLVTPAARHRARELGLSLEAIPGSGRHGAIMLRDVDRVRAAPAQPPAQAPAPAQAPPAPAQAPVRKPAPDVASPLRQAIGAAMARSKREIPHYYLAHTVSVRRLGDWLAQTNAALPVGERLLPAALHLRAVALALWEVPELNGTWQDGFRASEPVHLGVAVALRAGGVVAPAIHDVDQKTVAEVMADLRDLVRRARAGTLRGAELTDPTITVTSLGDRGPEAVFGVINPPQVAIVGLGGVVDRPWVAAGAVVVHPTMTITLSADHRVTDGHRGGMFLTALDRLLQAPEQL